MKATLTMRIKLILLALALLTIPGDVATAQRCTPTGCTDGPAAFDLPAGYSGWARSKYYPTWWYWWDAGRLGWGYEPSTDDYRGYVGNGRWTERMVPPWGVNAALRAKVDADKAGTGALGPTKATPTTQPAPTAPPATKTAPNFGVDEGKLHPPPVPPEKNFGIDQAQLKADLADGTRYHISGRPATRAEVMDLLQSQIPDDSTKWRLTVIGSTEERQTVLKDLAGSAELAPWREKMLVQAYPPDHWAVTQSGFHRGGRPTVYLQAADGKVLHRQDDYRDGAVGLALALRKADPAYDAKADKDNRKADPLIPGLNLDTRTLLILGAAGIGLWWLLRRQPAATAAETGPAQQVQTFAPQTSSPQTRPSPPVPVRPTAEPIYQPTRRERFTLGELIRAELQQRKREEEEERKRKAEREEDSKAFATLAGIRPAAEPEPPKE